MNDTEIRVKMLLKLQETIDLFEKEAYPQEAHKLREVAQEFVLKYVMN